MSLKITSAQVDPGEVVAGKQYILRVAITDSLAGWLLLRDANAADLRDSAGKYLFVKE